MKKRNKLFISIQESEKAIFRAAADIFSGFIAEGHVNSKNERDFMRKSVSHAMLMAEYVDEMVISDDEIDPDEKKGIHFLNQSPKQKGKK